jgi:hypothetical protein
MKDNCIMSSLEEGDGAQEEKASVVGNNPESDHGQSVAPEDQESELKPAETKKGSKKRKWRKPKDMPKRPLSAYNLFFAHERKEIIKEGFLETAASDAELVGGIGKKKMGFAGLARSVAAKWKTIDPVTRKHYEAIAGKEQQRYKMEMKEWKRAQEERKTQEEQFQSQFAAAGGMSAAAMVQLPGIGNMDETFMDPFDYASISNIRQPSALSSTNVFTASPSLQSQLPLWPAMPQTIASLGSIYNASSMVQRSTIDPNFDRATTSPDHLSAPASGTNTAESLRRNAQNQQLERLMWSFNAPPQQSPYDSATLPSTQAARHDAAASDSANVASLQRMNNLASQLDDEAVDFLSSLRNNPDQGRT